jgi:endoglucanase
VPRSWLFSPRARGALACALLALALPATADAYSVSGNQILDGSGRPIHIRGVSWFGFETQTFAVQGLWARGYADMIQQMKRIGINAVRLPFCPKVLRGAVPNSIDYNRNPDLRGKDALAVLDTIVAELDRQRMWILLDHHRPDCNAITELWYTPEYSEEQWIADLRAIAGRYRDVPFFLGVDLKNEPHGAATWGTGDRATDWKGAAERAAATVLAVAPDALIFVQGVEKNPTCTSSTSHWWGGNLEPQECAPLAIPANRLVLSPHVYGPNVFAQKYFADPEFPRNMPAIWDRHFGRFAERHAVVLGEFGSTFGLGGNPQEVPWFRAFADYLVQRGITNTFFWTWSPNSGDTGGLLRDDFQTPASEKIAVLERIWNTPPGGRAVQRTTPPAGAVPRNR